MNKALFLDRDGIINVDSGYVSRLSDFIFIEGIISFLKKAMSLGYKLIIVTNQSGIAREYFTEQAFLDLMRDVTNQLKAEGVQIEAVYHCPYHPDGTNPDFAKDHPDRKPSPGMILRALADHHIDPAESYIIGDHWRDIEAGMKAGLKGGFLVAETADQVSENQLSGFELHRLKKVSELHSFF